MTFLRAAYYVFMLVLAANGLWNTVATVGHGRWLDRIGQRLGNVERVRDRVRDRVMRSDGNVASDFDELEALANEMAQLRNAVARHEQYLQDHESEPGTTGH